MKATVFFVLAITLCLFSCHSKKENESAQGNDPESAIPYFITIEKPDFSSLKPLRLSEFADSVSYVQLETTRDCLMPFYGSSNMYKVDDFLFLTGIFNFHQFDATSGKFLRNIGKVGQGPGEYLQVNEAVDKENKIIYVKSPGDPKLLKYDYNGKYLGNLRFTDTEEFSFSTCFYSLKLLNIDSQYMTFISEMMVSEHACHPYELLIYDYKNNKIRHASKNQMTGAYERSTSVRNGMRTVAQYDKQLFYKVFYNDTLYAANPEKGITPYAILNFGKRKYPVEAFLEKHQGATETNGKILINAMHVNNKAILLECYMINSEKSNGSEWFICKYDKQKNALTYHSPHLLNDVDGGSNPPLYKLSQKVTSVTPADEIEDEYKEAILSNLDKSELKYPELKKRFEQMHNSRTADDNPLLMILYLKE